MQTHMRQEINEIPEAPERLLDRSAADLAKAAESSIARSIRRRSAGSGGASRQSRKIRVTRCGSILVAIRGMKGQ